MLVMARSCGESITIADRTSQHRIVTVLGIRGDYVELEVVDTSVVQHWEPRLMTRDESLQIADEVTITVVSVRGDKVRIGVHAAKRFTVHRLEVFRAIQGEGP
jgi:carbon storage regulator